MRLPQATASYQKRVRFARYVVARLGRKKRETGPLKQAANAVRTAGRKLEDLEEEVEERMAERDGADDDLDACAKEARRILGARSADAMTTAPYVSIFPDGIGYYTEATQDTNVERYGELKTRLELHLAPDDEVLARCVPTLTTQTAAFEEGMKAVAAARTAAAIGSTALDVAEDNLDRLLEKIYGGLISDVGKAEAERFFPRTRAARGRRTDEPADPPTDPA